MKHLEAFNVRRKSSDGRQNYCRLCRKAYGNSPEYHAAYNTTAQGVARMLMCNHNYSKEEAIIIATDLLNPKQRCVICGIPGWLVQLNHRRGGPFFCGGERQNRRLQPDRINTRLPHTLDNTRILCPTCNLRRGVEKFTDDEILRWVRYRWLSLFAHRKLWWMNTKPGEGGRLHRSPACEKRDAQFVVPDEMEQAFNEPPETEST